MNYSSYVRGALRYGTWLLFAVAVIIIIDKIASRFVGLSVWDDSYMFVRYADMVLTEGKIAFNPGGAPTYGLTSRAYLLVVLPMRLLVSDSPALAAILSSAFSGVLMFVALMFIVKQATASEDRETRYVAFALILFSLAYSRESLAAHFVSGMDTMFALLYLSGYVLVSLWHLRNLSRLSSVVVGCLGGLAFAVRPDLLIYTTILPVMGILFPDTQRARKLAVWILGGTVLLVLVQTGICALYFKSPLPLPFYAKGLGLYGQLIHEQYRLTPWTEVRHFVASFAALFIVIAASLIMVPKHWWRKGSSLDKGLLLSTLVFIGYYLLFVLQVMPTHRDSTIRRYLRSCIWRLDLSYLLTGGSP